MIEDKSLLPEDKFLAAQLVGPQAEPVQLSAAEEMVARQTRAIELLSTIRALGLAVIILFMAVGIVLIGFLTTMQDTRKTTNKLAQEQHAVLCDLYSKSKEPRPMILECP